MDKELEKILEKFEIEILARYGVASKIIMKDIKTDDLLNKAISQINSLFKKKAKECIIESYCVKCGVKGIRRCGDGTGIICAARHKQKDEQAKMNNLIDQKFK